jgi:uncharacterized protein YuzE
MRVEVDCDARVVYVTLAGGVVARTMQLSELVLVDEDEHGAPVSFEVLTLDALPVAELLSRYRLPERQAAILEALSVSWTPVRMEVA